MEDFDCLLVKSSLPFDPLRVQRWLKVTALSDQHPTHLRHAWTHAAENGQAMHHLYLTWDHAPHLSVPTVQPLEQAWLEINGQHAAISRLRKVLDLPGPAHGMPALAHYAVETDPDAGWDDEIAQWYAQEHLPGLARVPGCIAAQRFVNLDRSPSSFACYDLRTLDVLRSPEWLAVRATAWSDRCRAHFSHTLRTPFEHIQPLAF
jgi:hypothetical protein